MLHRVHRVYGDEIVAKPQWHTGCGPMTYISTGIRPPACAALAGVAYPTDVDDIDGAVHVAIQINHGAIGDGPGFSRID